MDKEISDFLNKKGILVNKQILNSIDKLDNCAPVKCFFEKINCLHNQKIITKSFLANNPEKINNILISFNKIDRQVIESFFSDLGIRFSEIGQIDTKNVQANKTNKTNNEFDVKLLKIYENFPRKIEVKDFVRNFRNRFEIIKKILQDRTEMENLVSINKMEIGKSCSIIALVYDKRTTKNGNIILEIEDLSGRISALVNKTRKEVFEKSNDLLLDEVIGLKCSSNGEIIFVNDIIFPDIKIFEKKKSKTDETAAFISDIHIGSNKFLEKNFMKLIKWLNGEAGDDSQRKEALKIKYLFIVGDTIDGVGIYPGQEQQLIIKDVVRQYEALGNFLIKIRSDINIIICPGQHDAVRVAEPQPIIGENYAKSLYLLKNIFFATNPCIVEIGKDTKFKVLMYHGASMHGIISSIDKLRMEKAHDSPTKIVKYMLKKRHLAPTHSLVTYIPLENEDALLIKETPDIVVTADLHRPEVSEYNNILLVASSCWQSITPFEEKVGNNPDPCKVPIFNLKTREIKILDFSDACEDEERGKEDNSERKIIISNVNGGEK